MKKTFLIISTLLIVLGCREPFDFDFQEQENPRVVIEGFISDRGTSHRVKVSYSAIINERGLIETQFVSDADVRIEDDQGSFTTFRHFEAGIYLSAPNYHAQEGRTYTLIVTLSNGEVYRSAPKTMPALTPATAQISWESDTRSVLINEELQDQEGAQINVTIHKDNNRHFYQWLIAKYFIYEADLTSEDSPIKYCYIWEFDESRIELLIDNPQTVAGTPSYQYELDFIPNDAKIEHDFGFEGRLLTMNEEDYVFWEDVKKLSENAGGLFDAAPFTIEGNMVHQASGEKILGYFGVYRETIDRVFFSEVELGFALNTYLDCFPPPGAPPDFHCFDCRTLLAQQNFGVVPPDWWRD